MIEKPMVKQRMSQTEFVVQASSSEMQFLWEKFCKDSMQKTELTIYTWEQLNPGFCEVIGSCHGEPVCVSVFWNKINGVLVMFYEAISQVVDHRLVTAWIEENCSPRYDQGRRLAHTNAANFHSVLNYIREKKAWPNLRS